MPVLSRSALESSPLADLHEIASELGLDGYRRLRKADLIAAILDKQGGADDGEDTATDDAGPDASDTNGSDPDAAAERPARRRSRGGRGRSRTRDRDPDADTSVDADAGSDDDGNDEAEPDKPARGGRRSRGAGNGRTERDEDRVATGRVELLDNGSGFVRVAEADDVYVSAAQIRRCELVEGDQVSGPVRAARRSERHPSLARVDTINGRAADEVAEGTRFEDLPAALPTVGLPLGDEQMLSLTPLGRGSRAVISGAPFAGKTELLRRIARALHADEELEVSVVLAGVRPEELADWTADGLPEPAASVTLGAPAEVVGQAVERAADTARRVAARGGNAVLLIDGLDAVPPHLARRALSSARDIVDGGSLTVIATATAPLGGETTIIALDVALTATGRFPNLDLAASGTLRPELLVGEKGAEALVNARAAAL